MISWQPGSLGINVHPTLLFAFYILLVPPVSGPSLKTEDPGVYCVAPGVNRGDGNWVKKNGG